MKWSSYIRPCIGVFFGLIDCIAATVLHGSGVKISLQLHIDMASYHFETSTIELWFISILRSSVLLGAAAGVMFNQTEGPKRLQQKSYIFIIVATVSAMFSVVKMLICTEYIEVTAWFWSEFAWSLVGCVTFYAGFVILRSVNVSTATVVNSSINDDEESRRLLPTTNEAETEQAKTAKEKISTVYRLLSYSKPDAHLLFVAFIFMVISSVCEYS
jgi:hypothetical protein